MQIPIPLLPLVVKVHSRCLPPMRTTLLGLMIAVAVSGVFLGLGAQLGRLDRAGSGDRLRAAEARRDWAPALAAWHDARAALHFEAHARVDLLLFVAILAVGGSAAVVALGRVLDLLIWRSSPIPNPEGTRS